MSESQLTDDEAAIREVARKTIKAEANEDLDLVINNHRRCRSYRSEWTNCWQTSFTGIFSKSFSKYDWVGRWTLESIDISGDLAVV